MSGRTIRIIGVLAFVLGVCLLTVPVALADSPWDYPSVTQDDTATQTAAIRPDDLPGARGPGTFSTEPVVSTTESGFDWTDAAIGGAAVLGVVMLVGIAVWMGTGHRPTTGRHAPT